jgi:predicted SPOUT superfamily RNA methylase MTH1
MSAHQLDIFAAIAARDEAVERVGRAAPAEWYGYALAVVQRLAERLDDFTTDDVWQALTVRPPEPRALGAVMVTAKNAGLIEPTDRTRQSSRPECHARPVRVWRRA